MPSCEIDRCYLLLRDTELLLLKNGESTLAAQLSMITGRLLLRYPENVEPTH